MNSVKQISFGIAGVRINEFAERSVAPGAKECLVENQMRAGVNKDQNQIIVGMRTRFLVNIDNIQHCLAELDMDAFFKVEEFDEMVKFDETNVPVVDPNLMISLVSITYSTARGILIGKSVPHMLPIVDPKNLMVTSAG
ncbi:MAG: hypothetical protein WC326_08225 [Candidatus Delongbacteria bacterium]